MRQAIAKFSTAGPLFKCPVCAETLSLSGSALRCANNHTFNISRKGYVDLRRKAVSSAHYTEEFFDARVQAMELGLYSDLIDALSNLDCARNSPERGVDVGCGDGYITRALNVGLGLDIAMEGIKVAARGGGKTLWVCGDGAHIPLVDGSVEWILNVFAPSEYQEFERVCPKGILVKVVPGSSHMHELRTLVGLPKETQDSATVLFNRHMDVIDTLDIVQTTHLGTLPERKTVATMSPVGFERVTAGESWKDLENITTHSRILVGRLP